jgi:hypothetical protein
MEFSPGRVTTALSVHGTTVIHQGGLVNDISSLSSAINEIDMEFKEIKNVNIETIGSLSQSTRPCPIKYKSMK